MWSHCGCGGGERAREEVVAKISLTGSVLQLATHELVTQRYTLVRCLSFFSNSRAGFCAWVSFVSNCRNICLFCKKLAASLCFRTHSLATRYLPRKNELLTAGRTLYTDDYKMETMTLFSFRYLVVKKTLMHTDIWNFTIHELRC
jgi:hypothetical protein